MYTPIVATLGYVLSEDGRKTLLVHRNLRTDDPHYGKYNGLGGKMEARESIHDCICREIKEEAGIICEEVVLRGTINWTGFGPAGEDWFGYPAVDAKAYFKSLRVFYRLPQLLKRVRALEQAQE